MTEKTFGLSFKIVMGVLLLSGCASSIFPDFADDTQVMIDDGGKVEYRKIDSNAIVVADKENAVYEDEETGSDLFVQNKDIEELGNQLWEVTRKSMVNRYKATRSIGNCVGAPLGVCGCMHAQSCLTLCNSMDCSPPGSSVHGILQAKILAWVASSFSMPCDLFI